MSTTAVDAPDTESIEAELSDYERERGKPMPSPVHSILQIRFAIQFDRHSDFDTYSELTIDFTGHRPYFTPDLSVYPKKKIDFLSTEVRATESPLLTLEILSPTQPYRDLLKHSQFYLEHGVKSCWIVVPVSRTVTILFPDGSQHQQDKGVITDSATGLSANLDEVFA